MRRHLAHGMMHGSFLVPAVAIALLCTTASVTAQLPTTELHWVFPPGAKAGTTIEVRVGGGNQEEATQLLFSHPGITAQVKTAPVNEFLTESVPQFGQFTVTVASDVPPGIYDAWLVGRFGVSNVKAFMVSHWEELTDDGANHRPEQARQIEVGTIVNGLFDARQLDFYRIRLAAGQRVFIDCFAERIDSLANATLIVYDAQRKELARNLDYVGYDPFVDFTAPADGQYVVAVHDFYYAGGNDYFYRLAVHQGPHVDAIFPAAGQAGAETEFSVLGRNLPGSKLAEGLLIEGRNLEATSLVVRVPQEKFGPEIIQRLIPAAASLDTFALPLPASLPVSAGISPVPVIRENEPNTTPEQAQVIQLPCEVNGRFYPALDVDWFEFEAKKGEQYIIEVISQRAWVGTDPFLLVQRVVADAQGQINVATVAEVDDPPNRAKLIARAFDYLSDDPEFSFVVPEDGRYRLMVRDQADPHAVDPRRVYRLQVRKPIPDFRVYGSPFQVKVDNDNQVRYASLVLRRGDVCWLKAVVQRRDGFAGEVVLAAEGLPQGVSCRSVILSPAQSEAWLAFEASEHAVVGVQPIRVVGRAIIDGQQVERPLQPASIIWATNNLQQMRPEYRLTRQLFLSVIADTAPATLQAGEDTCYETSLGGTVDIPLKLARRGEFKEALKFTVQNLPNELKPGDINLPADASEATLKVAVTNNNAKPGTYTFYLRADSKCKLVRHPEAVARVEKQLAQLGELIAKFKEELNQNKAAVEKAAAEQKNAADRLKQIQESVAQLEKMIREATTASEQAKAQAEAARKAAAEQPDNAALAEAAAAAQKEAEEATRRLAELEKQLLEARRAVTTAEQAEQQAKVDHQQGADRVRQIEEKLKRANETKTALEKQAADVRKANQPADVNIAVLSAPIRVRVHASPLEIQLPDQAQAIKLGEKLMLPVRLERRFGFADSVEITLVLPQGLKGIKSEKVMVPADQSEIAFPIEAGGEATPGQHKLTLTAKAKFGNFNVESTKEFTLEVSP